MSEALERQVAALVTRLNILESRQDTTYLLAQRAMSLHDDFADPAVSSASSNGAVYVDLAGDVTGPYIETATLGRWVVVDRTGVDQVEQKAQGEAKPSPVPASQVWIDLRRTRGTVYITLMG